jgi:hypothetical protein
MHGAYGQRSVSSSCDQYMSTFLLLLRPATQGEATRRDEGDSIRAMHRRGSRCSGAAVRRRPRLASFPSRTTEINLDPGV